MITATKPATNIPLEVEELTSTSITFIRQPLQFKQITKVHIDYLNHHFATKQVEEILCWQQWNLGNVVQVTSFGLTGMAIIHVLDKLQKVFQNERPSLIFVDTLHHFPETLGHVQVATEKYSLDLKTYRCKHASTKEEFENKFGSDLWESDSAQYDYLVKVEPLQRALDELKVNTWITGRRRDQGGNRKTLPIFEMDVDGRVKVNPLASWSFQDVRDYIDTNNVPINPLYNQNYKSIGDVMTTKPVGANEDERSGRWAGSKKSECGIHTFSNFKFIAI